MSSGSSRRPALGQRNFRLNLLSKCSFVALAVAGSGVAFGQTPNAGAGVSRSTAPGGETIVVTAQRRSEAISKVPVAVTALTSAVLSRHTVTKETDLQSIVPGLTVKTTGSQNQLNYAIRGQTLDAFSGSSPGVLTYVNDVQVSSQTATALYDLGNVQVLKGPQGTLFGRNATGGAVLYGTAMPSDEYHGFLTLRGGDYDMRQFTGAVDLPILPGQFTVRLAGDLDQQNGYVKNLHDNTTLGDTNAKSVRMTAKWTPNADITDVTVVQYGNYGGTNLVGELQSVNPVGSTYQGTPLNPTGAAIYGPLIFAALGKQDAQGPYTTNIPFTAPPFRSKTIFVENTFSYTFSPDLEFKNIAAYSRSDTYTSEILSGSPYGVIDLVQPDGAPTFFGIHQWSEEAQLLGHAFDSKLKYIVGVYAASEEDIDQVPVTVGFGLPTPVEAFNYNYNNRDSTQAVYGQATYDLSDLTTVEGLSITGGIRYTFEELSLFQTGGSLYQGMPQQSMSESKPSWQAGLQWQLNPQLLLYFVNRGSWRAGNFNGTTTPVDNQNAFNAETTYDFEVGAKYNGTILGKSTRLAVALYDQTIDNVQRDVYFNILGKPASFTHNVPQAEVRGVEFDGDVRLLDWLSVGGNFAYTDAEYTQPNVTLFGQDITFGDYQDTPRWSGSVFADITLPAPERWGVMTLHTDFYAQTHTYYSSLAFSIDPGTELRAYNLLNMRYDWKRIFGSNISAAAFVKNLTNDRYYIGGYALGADVGINTHLPGAPQEFGGELNIAF